MDLVVDGNFDCCLIIACLMKAYRLQGNRGEGERGFEVIIWGQATKGWDHFYGES